MSVYEEYDTTSAHYDSTRVPIGGEIVLGCLACHHNPLEALHVLDAGCGTGAYAEAIVDRVGRVEAIDLSAGMLAQARAKLARQTAAGRIGFHRAPVTDLPFADETFDGVMINQVLHHLDAADHDAFPVLRRAVAEAARVLKPGGVLLCNHCGRHQLRDGYWYAALVPGAAAAFRARFMPLEDLRAALFEAGLSHRGSFVPLDAVCQGPAYFDGRGPLDPVWRAGDSLWALASREELDAALDKVRTLDAQGGLTDFVAANDARRPEVGQITFLAAVRN